MDPTKFILLCLAGWLNREQQAVIDYQREEIRVLKEIHGKRPRFNDEQRRRLAAKAKKIRFGQLRRLLISQHRRHCFDGFARWWLRNMIRAKPEG